MEDVVGIRTVGESPEAAFMTWGRIFDPVDGVTLITVIRRHLPAFGIGESVELAVCDTLQEVSNFPYFYEALLSFAMRRIPYGDGYEAWRQRMAEALARGEEIDFLGRLAERIA
jgi:hypothetical protein